MIRPVGLDKYMKKQWSACEKQTDKCSMVTYSTCIFNLQFDPLYQSRINLTISFFFFFLLTAFLWSGLKEKLQKQEKELTEKDLDLREKNEVIAALKKKQDNTKGELEKVKNENRGQWKGHPLLKIRGIFGSKMGKFRLI